jgi:GNAT superfamily N-acetyltransferase
MQPKVPSSDQAGYMPQEPVALTIRPATIADAALITRLITRLISELAEFDNALHEARKIEADILPDGFGADPRFRALIAEWLSEPAVFFGYYSTWRGAGVYLEDLFVCPGFRRRGVGISQRSACRKLLAVTSCRNGRQRISLAIVFANVQKDLSNRGTECSP